MKSHRKMAADQQPPSFFHILMNPSSPYLPLPSIFVTRHLRNEILEDPIIKSANGGYLWKLKMKKIDDRIYCLVDGWCNVVKDVGLSFGEFLLFRYVGRSGVFLMHVYSVNGCEKILVPKTKFVDYGCIDDDDEVEEEEDVVFDMDDDDDHHHHVEDEDDVVVDEDDDDVDDHHHVEDDDDVEFDDDEYHDMEEEEAVLYDVDDGDDVEDEDDVEFVYDRDDDSDDVDVDGDDGDPFFILTSSKSNINKLRFSPNFVALARIDTRETITLKNDDGYEKEMTVQSDKKSKSSSYYVATGWKEFQVNSDISVGDKCVFKFVASEDKICLAKVTKKKTPARPLPSGIKAPLMEVDADDVEDDDGMEYKDAEDDNDKDEDEDVELVDEDDPFFVVTITPTHNRVLRMPADFVQSAGIDSKRTLRVRSLDGKEMTIPVQFDTQYGYHEKRYFLLKGWKDFMQGTNISEGDKCVFKFIPSEDKLCLAKITKPWPAAEALATEVNDDDDDKDENEDVGPVDDEDPFFVATITASQNSRLYLPADFVGLAGIDTKENIVMISLDGNECQMDVRKNKQKLSTCYHLYRWNAFMWSNNISQGDKCVFKYLTSEDKMCLAKIIKSPAREVYVDDRDPSFVATITLTDKYMLRLPPDFVALSGIDTRENIIMKSLDGNESQMTVRLHKRVNSAQYNLSLGWVAFKQSNNISQGDECVFKYITSEDKMCLVKITKASATEVDGMDVEDDTVTLVDETDPFFVVTIIPSQKSILLLPRDFVVLARIGTKENIIIKSLDGKETQIALQSYNIKWLTRYCFSAGWTAFKRSNNISDGDECVFKYIKSEDKMCLEKITKKITRATLVPAKVHNDDTDDKDGKGEDAKLVDDDDVNDSKEDDYNVDGDPSFALTISKANQKKLNLPIAFVRLAGIVTKKNIVMISLDGNEHQMAVGNDKRSLTTRYHLSKGWPAFMRSNNVSQGDKCVFKFITSEDKMCLAKIVKALVKEVDVDDKDPSFVVTITTMNKAMLRFLPDFVTLAGIHKRKTVVFKSINGYEKEMTVQPDTRFKSKSYFVASGWKEFIRDTDILEGDICVFKFIRSEDKICLAKITKKKTATRLLRPTIEPPVMEVDAAGATSADDEDENEDVERIEYGDDGDPFFVATISHKFMVRLPSQFVALAKIDTKENIIIKSLDGVEKQMAIQSYKQYRCLIHYHLSVGWPAFRQSNNISEGDECVFKYIRGEDKLCLEKVTKRKTRARSLAPAVVVPEKVDTDDDGINGKGLEDDKDEDEDEDVELDDGDPFFVTTISDKRELYLPVDFVRSAGIDTKKTLTLLGLEGYEMEMPVVWYKSRESKRYYVAKGWPEFRRNNALLEGDKCLFKLMKSDDKLCVAKVPLSPAIDDDPCFVKTISHKRELYFPVDFVRSARIDTKKTLTLLGLDGYEKEMHVRYCKSGESKRYYVAKGWPAFRRNNALLEGDKCLFKLITSADKLCVAKVNKKITPTSPLPPAATDDDAKDENEDVERVADPFFVATISHKFILWLPSDFVVLAKVDTKENIIIKSLDGNERQMAIQSYKHYHLVRYHFSIGWPAFRRSNNISQGDECVFKYIRSEDKMCLVKVTKRKTQAMSSPPAAVATETEVDADDAEDDDSLGANDKDEEEDADLVVDDGPFFVTTITQYSLNKCFLRMPVDFVRSAGIDTKKTIRLKSLDGYEKELHVRYESHYHYAAKQYFLGRGWMDFTRNTNISAGDKCLFKFITSEDKLCLAKITKAQPTQFDDDDVEVDRCMHDKDADKNVELADGVDGADPFFEVTITTIHKSMLRLPSAFVGLSGIDAKENIIIKSLDGNERLMALRSYQQNNSTHHCLSMGWPAFKRNNSISEGDECVFKYITSEDKMCLAKVTNTKTQTRLSSPAKVVKRKRGRPAKITMTENVKITVEEVVKRKRGRPAASPQARENVKRKRSGRAAWT